jgi:hypothetical protein
MSLTLLLAGGNAQLTAQLSQTLGDVSVASAASNAVTSAAANTLGAVALAAGSVSAVSGSLEHELASTPLSSVAVSAIAAAVGRGLEEFTLSASGSIADLGVQAECDMALADVLLTAGAVVAVSAESGVALGVVQLESQSRSMISAWLGRSTRR